MRSTPVLAGVVAIILLAALVAAPPAFPQTSESDPLPGFSELVEVRAVNIEVTVTDRNGVRVHGLEQDDFRLEIDGEPRDIDYFAEVRDGRLVETAAADGPFQPFPGIAGGAPITTSYLLFVDDYFSEKNDRDVVLRELEQSLEYLPEGDRMAVVAYDGEGLDLLSTWSTSRAEIEDALEQARRRPAHGLQRRAELRLNDDQIEDTRRFFRRPFRTNLTPLERQYADRLAEQLEHSVMAASSALRAMAMPPGRKVMILLSGGWPFSPAEYAVNTYFATFDDVLAGTLATGLPGRARLYEPLVDTANLLSYTLYPVDVPGLQPFALADASRTAPRPTLAGVSVDRENQLEYALRFLADETGGEALLNGRRTRALQSVVQDTRSYYWLGYTPKRTEDGARHDIDVEVLEKGFEAEARKDYVEMGRSQELDMMVESALLFGNPPTDQPLSVEIGESREGSPARRLRLPVEIGIPMESVLLVEQNDRHQGRLELRFQAMGPDGAMSDTAVRTITVDEPREPKPGEMYVYETELVLRPNTKRVVVAVYDPLSGAILSRVVPLEGALQSS